MRFVRFLGAVLVDTALIITAVVWVSVCILVLAAMATGGRVRTLWEKTE